MAEFYFDIETTGLNGRRNQAILAAFQKISHNRPDGPLVILKSWDLGGEKRLLNRIELTGVFKLGTHRFDFVPVGKNLRFDLSFLVERMRVSRIRMWTREQLRVFFHEKPLKDIDTIVIMMNNGRFVGSGLESFSGKKSSGRRVVDLWGARDYAGIERYVTEEAEAFFELYRKVTSALLRLGKAVRISLV